MRVVLPASGCEMMAKVHRRAASAEAAVTSADYEVTDRPPVQGVGVRAALVLGVADPAVMGTRVAAA